MPAKFIYALPLIILLSLACRLHAQTAADLDQLTDDQKFDDKMNLVLRDFAAAGQGFKPAELAQDLNQSPSRTLSLPSPEKVSLDDAELYSRAAKSTLALFSNTCSGATALRGSRLGVAVVIDPSGIAITCFHAIRFNEPFVMVACTDQGKQVNVKSIISVFPRQDLALLQLEGEAFSCLPIRTGASAGTQVELLGHPLSLHFFVAPGMLSRYVNLPSEGKEKSPQPRLDLSVQSVEGFSGAAVLDRCGNMLGMQDSKRSVQRGDDTYEYASAIPASMILTCLKGDYNETLTPQEKLMLLNPQQPLVITSRNSQGRVVSEVVGQNVKMRIFDATGNVIGEGAPSEELRAKLPPWAQGVYDDNLKAVNESKKK